jgi:hypothetical protein
MIRIYKRLLKFCRNKVREQHLQKYNNDVKCPNCNDWFSLSSLNYKHEHVTNPSWGFHLKCGQCKHESYWNAEIAPVLILCNANGIPLEKNPKIVTTTKGYLNDEQL